MIMIICELRDLQLLMYCYSLVDEAYNLKNGTKESLVSL